MLQDARGCLTETGFRALAAAAPGAAPAELAAHVAACPRCQDRALAEARTPAAARGRPSTSRLWLGVFVVIAGLVLALVALLATRMLATAPP